MRYLIMGTGGVGGFFGGKLASIGEDVWFVARGKHFQAMKERGLCINSTGGQIKIPPDRIIADVASVGQADVVFFCVKSYDTETAARQLSSILKEDSIVLSLQNGVDNEDKIKGQIQRGVVLGGAAYISSRITAPGEISEVGGFQRIVFGPMNGPVSPRAQEIHECLVRSGVKSQLQNNIVMELWRKLIFIASMGSLTAMSRLTHGEILSNPPILALMFDAMREVQAVARKQGIDIEPIDEPRVLEGLKRFSDDTRSSMYFDLVSNRPLEIEALNGTVVRLGERLGVPTPIHRVIYSVLLPYHLKHSQLQASR